MLSKTGRLASKNILISGGNSWIGVAAAIARGCRVGLARVCLDQAGQVPRELLPRPAHPRSARDDRDAEGAGRIDIRGDHLQPGLEEEADLVSGVEGRPNDSSGHGRPPGDRGVHVSVPANASPLAAPGATLVAHYKYAGPLPG